MKKAMNKIFRLCFPTKSSVEIKKKYHLPESVNFSLRLTPDGWFVLTMPDHPGLITEAQSHQSLIEMMNDAVLSYYDVPKREADIVYDRLNIGDFTVQYHGELKTQLA